jgi:glycosyltransferase involved in cell wall biosynthesis
LKDLILYTESFPYGSGETFLETEIRFLSDCFNRVYIIPAKISGNKKVVPSNVHVLDGLFGKKPTKVRSYMLSIKPLIKAWYFDRKKLPLHTNNILAFIKYFGMGCLFLKKVHTIWLKNNLVPEKYLHYTYWLSFQAFSLAIYKIGNPSLSFVSRAHRFDLYRQRNEPGLDYIKPIVLKYINRLFLISQHGLNYITDLYPEHQNKFCLSLLGTINKGSLNPLNESTTLIIASCSTLRPVKRVMLICEALKYFSVKYPDFHVMWHHLGSGPQLNEYRKTCAEKVKSNSISINFLGQVSNKEVFDFYAKQALDVFINVSESEGLPVSIMEAQSFGIPVIATAVGGTDEIVNNKNGILLSPDPTLNEIADALFNAYSNKMEWNKKRRYSRDSWDTKYNAEKNYMSFVKELRLL